MPYTPLTLVSASIGIEGVSTVVFLGQVVILCCIPIINAWYFVTPYRVSKMPPEVQFAPLVSLTPAQLGRRGPRNMLHDAASMDSVEGTVSLLSKGLIDIDQGEPMGWTPLMCATEKGHLSVTRILLSRGADVSVLNDYGFTALLLAIQHGYSAIAKMLITAGADIETATPQGRAPLHLAADDGNLAISKMLIKAGADIDTATPQGDTPLHIAASGGYSKVVRALIQAGANPNSRMPNGETPLYFAAEWGHVNAVRELLRGKANALLTKTRALGPGEFNLQWITRTPPGYHWLPLHLAILLGNSEVVREMIHQRGLEGCCGTGSLEALRLAAIRQDVDLMAMLMEAGVVDPGECLVVAAARGSVASVMLLLEQNKGETSGGSTYVNYRTAVGSTPLMSSIICCETHSPRVARLLVDAGAHTTSPIPIACWVRGVHVQTRGTPRAVTDFFLREKVILGQPATDEQLHRLEAIRRLLLQVAAIHAVSWLWSIGIPFIAHAAERSGMARVASPPLTGMLPILRRRIGRRGVLMSALFRWVVM